MDYNQYSIYLFLYQFFDNIEVTLSCTVCVLSDCTKRWKQPVMWTTRPMVWRALQRSDYLLQGTEN